MSYLFSTVSLLLSFIKKQSKITMIFMFILMWILFGFNTGNADYMTYEFIYKGFYPNHEFGFMALVKFFNMLGFSYQHFLITISFIGLFFLIKVINKYTKNINYVLALYFIFPFMLDVVQVRNFLTMVLIICGIDFLISKEKFSTIKYIGFVILASSIHYSSLFYLVLLVVKFLSTRQLLIFPFLSLALVALAYTNILPFIINSMIDNTKILFWFQDRSKFGFLISAFIQITGFIFIYIAYKKSFKFYKKNKVSLVNSIDMINFYEIILKINLVLFLIYPLYIFNMTFFRLYRNLLILNYIAISNIIQFAFNNKFERFVYQLCFIVYIILLMTYFICFSAFDTVFIPIFNRNLIL